ncbi:hypothetical protein [Anaerolentibacter hominis]|uniref:hypothetical protein n=1 Tax=Anaerolentibacter hominis TaxID=3079009 RepID=UPI0031B86652
MSTKKKLFWTLYGIILLAWLVALLRWIPAIEVYQARSFQVYPYHIYLSLLVISAGVLLSVPHLLSVRRGKERGRTCVNWGLFVISAILVAVSVVPDILTPLTGILPSSMFQVFNRPTALLVCFTYLLIRSLTWPVSEK